jgi:thiol-disulfide isomerase/thioredoxin
MKIKRLLTVLMGLLWLCPGIYAAEVKPLNEFKTGSYRQILDNQAGKPFVLIIWSLTCPSCIKDMELLDELHKKNPQLAFVMLSTDEPPDAKEIKDLLEKHRLADVENWVFADDNAQKLRFEIDPTWFGEMPRTYFFDNIHNRTGISGVLSRQDFAERIARIAQ